MLKINYFKAYSENGSELLDKIDKYLAADLKAEIGIDVVVSLHDSKGLSRKKDSSPYKVLSAALQNEIVIIDASIEEVEGYKLGVNYECITPAVSSLDNVLIVSRTQLPLNFIACRSNVAPLGEKDPLHGNRILRGYARSYNNEQIYGWICGELKKMHDNGRLFRSDDLYVDLALPSRELIAKEMEVLSENVAAVNKERYPKKKIFISYRSAYFADCSAPENYRYKGQYNVLDVAKEIMAYHKEQGDMEDWEEPFYYPQGVLSNEFMPEVRRWAFVAMPYRKIRECDEFWIFNTSHADAVGGKKAEVGYWDSWWCLGEFLTIVRMKYNGQLRDGFKVMLFNPDSNNEKFKELTYEEIPEMTGEQNRELARYFANGDFLEAGYESMESMRSRRKWPKFFRRWIFRWLRDVVWPIMTPYGDDFKDYTFERFEESIWSHVYDKSFVDSRILSCRGCAPVGRRMWNILLDKSFVWNFLNINGQYARKYNLLERQSSVIVNDDTLEQYRQPDGTFLIPCSSKGCDCKTQVRLSEDKFYILWTPKGGKPTGPDEGLIEIVDLYEVV